MTQNEVNREKKIKEKKSKEKRNGIYIHIPFCARRCSYCVFTTFYGTEEIIKKYIEKLIEEINLYEYKEKAISGESVSLNQKIDTIFIGGGTPSYIKPKYIKMVLDAVRAKFNVCEDAEITMESNPSSITEEGLKVYKVAGINRISMGLQSTNNTILKRAERLHTFEEFKIKYELAKKYYSNINLDVIMGLPLETQETFKQTLKDLISLNPNHISMYELSVEESSKLYHSDELMDELPLESKMIDMQRFGIDYLTSNGYHQYELSNYSKPGFHSRHNYNCWMQHEYIGFGVSASSFIAKYRHTQTKSLDKYLQEGEKTFKIDEILDLDSYIKDYLFIKLRTISGVTYTSIFKRINEYINSFIKNTVVKVGNFKVDLNSSEKLSDKEIETKAKIKTLNFIRDLKLNGFLNYDKGDKHIFDVSNYDFNNILNNNFNSRKSFYLRKDDMKKSNLKKHNFKKGKYFSKYTFKTNFNSMYGEKNIFREILSSF